MTPEVGTVLENPVTGTRQRFTATAASTDGAYVEVEATYPPNSSPPPAHLHPKQTEHFTVLTGRLTVVVDGKQFTASADDDFLVAPGSVHQMWNDADGAAVVRWRTSPALCTGELFCALWELDRDNEWRAQPLQRFEVVSRFTDEFALA